MFSVSTEKFVCFFEMLSDREMLRTFSFTLAAFSTVIGTMRFRKVGIKDLVQRHAPGKRLAAVVEFKIFPHVPWLVFKIEKLGEQKTGEHGTIP